MKEEERREKAEEAEEERREKERKMIEKAKEEIKKYMEHSYSLGEKSKEHYADWGFNLGGVEKGLLIYPFGNTKKEPFILDKDKVINLVIKNNYNVKEVIDKIVERELIKIETEKIKRRQHRLKLKQQAEREYFGKEKTKRQIFSNEEKEAIFDKFHHECATCNATEGLHIHHKDGDPKNNKLKNLIVLCGVCHKKVHMKVR